MFRPRRLAFLPAVGLLWGGTPALAGAEPAEVVAAPSDVAVPPRTTVALAPCLLGPFAEVMVERRVTPWLGLAAVGGYGWSLGRSDANSFWFSLPTYEAGVQVRAHLFVPARRWASGDFAVGVQGLYDHVRGSQPAGQIPFVAPPGLSVGPVVTMTTIFASGFTMSFETGFPIYLEKEPTWGDLHPWNRVAWFERTSIGWSFQ